MNTGENWSKINELHLVVNALSNILAGVKNDQSPEVFQSSGAIGVNFDMFSDKSSGAQFSGVCDNSFKNFDSQKFTGPFLPQQGVINQKILNVSQFGKGKLTLHLLVLIYLILNHPICLSVFLQFH